MPCAFCAERIYLSNATTAYGRVFLTIQSVSASSSSAEDDNAAWQQYHVNLTLSQRFAAVPPPGGLAVRIRAPGYLNGKRISAVLVGGKALSASAINATAETVFFPTLPTVAADLENIIVTVS